jgi:hypothetical protein
MHHLRSTLLSGGAYNKQQDYSYKFEGQKFNDNEYKIKSATVYAGGQDVTPEGGLKEDGTFTLRPDQQVLALRGLSVQVDVEAEEKLDGTEALTLTVDNVSSVDELNNDSPSKTAFIKNFNDCGIDGLVQDIEAVGACIDDNKAKNASFAFNVIIGGAYNKQQDYSYKFEGQKFNDNEYKIKSATVYAGGQDVTPEGGLKEDGTFTLRPDQQVLALRGLSVQVDVEAEEKLDGTEALTLTVDNVSSVDELNNDSPSKTAFIKNFNDCGIDGLVQGYRGRGSMYR